MGVSTRRGPDQAWYSVPGLLLLWRRRAVARGAALYSVPSQGGPASVAGAGGCGLGARCQRFRPLALQAPWAQLLAATEETDAARTPSSNVGGGAGRAAGGGAVRQQPG